ncbi:hypothetical protein [Kyrpidia spormannii]|uniref:hypothetical protein n=1 Tax=Kyrpidia spormannii TaxID=2055160 RepID=UPI001E62E652|nr:hypothetical protein [Kyrpidia spormannii]
MALRHFNATGADSSGRLGERHDPETHLIPIVLEAALGRREQVTVFGTDYDTGWNVHSGLHLRAGSG